MSEEIDVSILITSHNEIEFLSQSIESALNQTYKPSEIVVVDANSDDGSPDLIRRYADNHPRVITPVILDEDPGIPAMRNIAIDQSSSKLYTFLDGDDWFRAKKLEKEVSTYKSNDAANVIYSNYELVNKDGERQYIWIEDNANPPKGNVLPNILARDWPRRHVWRSALVEKALAKKVGGYDEELDIWEDWEFRIRLSQLAEVDYCSEVLSVYRRHEDGASSKSDYNKHIDCLSYIENKHKDKFGGSATSELQSSFKETKKYISRKKVTGLVKINRKRAIFKNINHIYNYPSSIADYKLHAMVFLPERIYYIVKQIWDRLLA